ncbi:hypothetical protein XELAEV_18030200mg [Xenopus laevis]|uniref:Uncharacterized protein n=1 Tax=Xenopus laevis TaxID=8355 RepID=A0A974CTA7_XENLA|nr:hypothetical protein XELAEV_18030200mg [Xenopus laevis]
MGESVTFPRKIHNGLQNIFFTQDNFFSLQMPKKILSDNFVLATFLSLQFFCPKSMGVKIVLSQRIFM